MKKILVTGHTGFIGSHLVDLLKKNYEIIGLSRNAPKNPDIVQIKGDIRKITAEKIPKNLDSIIHMAAMTDILYCQNNPIECFDVNVNGTQNMLELAKKTKTKFFYISTHHVYGKPATLPVKETCSQNPSSIYSASKAAAELVSTSYSLSFGFSVPIAFTSGYGAAAPG